MHSPSTSSLVCQYIKPFSINSTHTYCSTSRKIIKLKTSSAPPPTSWSHGSFVSCSGASASSLNCKQKRHNPNKRDVPWKGIRRADKPHCPKPHAYHDSGLVTQTLLVTVLTHALAALMLIDLGFTSLLEGSHIAWLMVSETDRAICWQVALAAYRHVM